MARSEKCSYTCTSPVVLADTEKRSTGLHELLVCLVDELAIAIAMAMAMAMNMAMAMAIAKPTAIIMAMAMIMTMATSMAMVMVMHTKVPTTLIWTNMGM